KPALPAQYSFTAASFACSVYLPMTPPKVASNLRGSHQSVRNDHLNYRAALCVVCLSGRSASSCDAERRELHSHAGA
ncbi:hypothetical protein CXB36_12835, partial [Pseudomonas syringae pv. syringae]